MTSVYLLDNFNVDPSVAGSNPAVPTISHSLGPITFRQLPNFTNLIKASADCRRKRIRKETSAMSYIPWSFRIRLVQLRVYAFTGATDEVQDCELTWRHELHATERIG
jgi:hypothetical protein